MEQVYVPRLLDEKERLLFLHVYEIVAFIAGFGIGIAFKMPVIGIILGSLAFSVSRYMKRKGLVDTLANILYWYLPEGGLRMLTFKVKGTPPSAYRIMTG